MTSSAEQTRTAEAPLALATRAMLPGFVFAGIGLAVVALSGRVEDETLRYIAAGAAVAACTGAVGVLLKARAFTAPRSANAPQGLDGQRLQIALFGDFAIQLFTVGGTLLAQFLAGVKFPNLVGFALAFAAVAVGHLFGSSLVLVRTLRRRAAHGAAPRVAGSNPGGDPRSIDPRSAADAEATSVRGPVREGAPSIHVAPRSTGSPSR